MLLLLPPMLLLSLLLLVLSSGSLPCRGQLVLPVVSAVVKVPPVFIFDIFSWLLIDIFSWLLINVILVDLTLSPPFLEGIECVDV